MSSVACGPITWTPSTAPVSAWAMTLANPSRDPWISAFATAWNGTLPIATGSPRSAHCASVRPTDAISGRVYVARGWDV